MNLVFKHIEEVEVLEKKRYNDKLATDRSALFAGAAPVKIGSFYFFYRRVHFGRDFRFDNISGRKAECPWCRLQLARY